MQKVMRGRLNDLRATGGGIGEFILIFKLILLIESTFNFEFKRNKNL